MFQQSKRGQEPFVVYQLDEFDNTDAVHICGNTILICETPNLMTGFLLLLAVYIMMNLDYPPQYLQILGMLQDLCLGVDFLVSLQGASYALLKNMLT